MLKDRYRFLSRREFFFGTAASLLALRAAAECQGTSAAIEGPYWRRNAPEVSDLAGKLPGERLVVRGRVQGPKCRPIANALLEVWGADAKGKYDIDDGGDVTFLRARIRTDAEGRYAFTTIRPAPYGLGGSMRPAHIHFKISGADRRLTTQLYFGDDPYVKRDPLRAVHDDLVKPVQRLAGRSEVVFDIVL